MDHRRIKWTQWALAASWLGFLLFRWTTKGASFAAAESDFGEHFSIIQWVENTPRWPPVYNGMLGAHTAAAALHRLGVPLPKAMLVLSDLAVSLMVYSIGRMVWPLGLVARLAALATTVVFSLPLFSTMNRDAYFGPILACALYAAGAARLITAPAKPSLRELACAAAWFLAGTLTYPDAAVWCFPFLLSMARDSVPRLWWGAAALLAMSFDFVVLHRQLELLPMPGGGTLEWFDVLKVVAAAALIFAIMPQRQLAARRFQVLFVGWVLVASLLSWMSLKLTGHLEYYARKSFYSLIFLLPVLAGCLCQWRVLSPLVFAGIAALGWLLPVTLREPLGTALSRMADPRSHFDARDEACVSYVRRLSRQDGCRRLLVLPGSKIPGHGDEWGQRILRITAANSLTGEYSAEHGLRAIKGQYSGPFQLADLLRRDPEYALALVKAQRDPGVDCLAVGPDLLPAEQRPTSKKCLVVIRASELPEVTPEQAPDVEGFQDHTGCEHVEGWAFSPSHPDERVTMELMAEDQVVATVRANLPRGDLAEAGKGDGIHGFDIPVPPSLRDGRPHQLSVRVAGTPLVLPGLKEILCTGSRSNEAGSLGGGGLQESH